VVDVKISHSLAHSRQDLSALAREYLSLSVSETYRGIQTEGPPEGGPLRAC
jgi:hypothetical protein